MFARTTAQTIAAGDFTALVGFVLLEFGFVLYALDLRRTKLHAP